VDRGGHASHGGHGIRLLVDVARKRELIETLWAAGSDVVSVNPLKDTLEEVFLNLVGGAQ
jgi:hypothetical protein